MVKKYFYKLISGFLVITIASTQLVFAQEPLAATESPSAVKPFMEKNDQAEIPSELIYQIENTQDFLENSLALTSFDPQEDAESQLAQNYEYERYDFQDALDLLRPEYAAAVIVKNITENDVKELLNLSFETGILVIHGEIVLFTSGSEDEIGILPAVKALTDKASFISHTHPNEHSSKGPSGQDINEAIEAPNHEYVVTEKGAYAYNNQGRLNDGNPYSFDSYIREIKRALTVSSEDRDQVEARKDLNLFIAEQDRFNKTEEGRVTFRRGGTLTYTAGLSSSNVTTLSGNPRPYFIPGSTSATVLSGSSDKVTLDYSVVNAGDISGFSISFDDASTAAVETQNIGALTNLTFGLKGPNTSVILEVTDVNNIKDVWTLTNISNSTERFWQLPVSSISNVLDKTKIRQLNFIVNHSHTSVQTGALAVRVKGINVDTPEIPAVTSSLPQATNQTSLSISGTKEANTAILINGVEVVSRNGLTTWTAMVDLTKEGNNSISVKAKNSIGKTSSQNSLTVKRDTILPAGTVVINGGAPSTESPNVVLALTATDSGAGLDQMRFSMDAGQNWSVWENVLTSKSLTLPTGNGLKEVRYQLRDKAGNTAVFTDTINDLSNYGNYERTLEDGTKLFYESEVLVREHIPNGNKVFYGTDGSVTKFRYSTGQEIRYLKSPDNKIQRTDASGVVIETIDKPIPSILNEAEAIRANFNGGLSAYYAGGNLVELRTITGIRITDFTLNESSAIQNALISFPDGKIEIVRDGHVLRRIHSDGSVQDFTPAEFLVREIFLGKVQYAYFEKISQTQTSEIRLFTPDGILLRYDELGILKEVKGENAKHFIYNRTLNGSVFILNLDSGQSSSCPEKGLIQAEYTLSGDLKKMVLKNGTSIFMEDGRIIRVLNENNQEIRYSYSQEQELLNDLQISRGDSLFKYDNQGFLSEIGTASGIIRRTAIDSNGDGQITDQDEIDLLLESVEGNKLSDFELDSDGNILQGIIETREGIKQRIENGILTGFETADGKLYEVQNTDGGREALLKEWKLSDGTRVLYGGQTVSEIIFPDGRRLDQISFNSKREIETVTENLQDGARKFFENNKLVKILTASGVQAFYGNTGFAEKIVLPDSSEQRISYKRLSDGSIEEILFTGDYASRAFKADGTLLRLLMDGAGVEFVNGEVSRLFTEFSTVENPAFNSAGVLSGTVHFIDGTQQIIVNGALTESIRSNGTRVFYNNGKINAIQTQRGRYELIYSENGTGNLEDAKIRLVSEEGNPEFPLIPYLLNPLELTMAPFYRDDSFMAAGNAKPEEQHARFGSSGIEMTGDGDYLEIPDGGSPDFQYGNHDFTVDFWFRMDAADSMQKILWSQYAGAAGLMWLYIGQDNKLHTQMERNGQIWANTITSLSTLNAGQWYHTAFVRSGNTVNLYLNGHLQGASAVFSSEAPSGNFSVNFGATASGVSNNSGWIYNFSGAMDEIRISKGIARWTSDFLLPSHEYKRDAYTTKLYHFLTSRDKLPTDPELSQILLGRDAHDVLSSPLKIESGFIYQNGESEISFVKTAEDPDRGTVYEFGSNYTPTWDVSSQALNGGFIFRNLTMDLSDNQPALTSDLVDINGDGLPDRVFMTDSYADTFWYVQINRGDSFEPPIKWMGVDRRYDVYNSSSFGMTMGSLEFYMGRLPHQMGDLKDMNGDGLPDRVIQKFDDDSVWYVQINNGHGFEPLKIWDDNIQPYPIWHQGSTYSSQIWDDTGYKSVQEMTVRLIDMDGDGRPDRILRPAVGPYDHWFFQKNTGNGFESALLWTGVDTSFNPDPKMGGSIVWYALDSGGMGDLSDIVDMNGDERPDRLLLKLKNPSNPQSGYAWYVQFNNGHGFDPAVVWDLEVRNVPGPWTMSAGTTLRLFDYANSQGKRSIISDLRDVNGDGLTDRVSIDNYNNNSGYGPKSTWWVELNTGAGFAPAVAWTGIEGVDLVQTAIGQDSWHRRSFGASSYGSEPAGSVTGISDLEDLNGDEILDRIYFAAGESKWRIQYGTGAGFLPSQTMEIEFLQSPTNEVSSSRYDYLHVSLKSSENIPAAAGVVKIMLGDPENPETYQEWAVSDFDTDWKDVYLPLDKAKENASQVKIKFEPAGQNPNISIYVDNLTFLTLRPDASKDWLDRMLTEENILEEVHSDRSQTLAQYLGLSQASAAIEFDWNMLLKAETKINFNEEGQTTKFQTLYGAVSKVENGHIVETVMPDGSKIEFGMPSEDYPQRMIQIATQSDGAAETQHLNYGRVRTVERPGKQPLAYSYEFDGQGNEITVVYDPETQTREKYRDEVLISRQLNNGVDNKFFYNSNSELISTEVSYKGRIYHVFNYQNTVSGNRLVKTDDGTIEEYNPESQIVAHATPDGYHYKHTFEHAPRIVTGSRQELLTLSDGTELSFSIPTIDLVADPAGEMVHRVTLDSYQAVNGTKAFYENGVLKSIEWADGARIVFSDLDIQIIENENGTTSQQIKVLDAAFFYADGTVTEFKNARPWAIISAAGHEVSLAEDKGQLINSNESAVFHQAEALKLWNEALMPAWQAYQVPDILPVRYEYDTDGTLLTRQFAEGSIELYENGKIKNVFAEDGEELIAYEHDGEGNQTAIHMSAIRRHLEMSVQQLRADVAVQHETALSRLASRDQVINQTIEGQYLVARDRLFAIRTQIQEQMNTVAAFSVKGKEAKNIVGDIANQISVTMNQVNSALENLARQRSSALEQLSAQVRDLSIQIETETQISYAQIDAESQKAQKTILRQEISPVLYHWYRKILGRDPSQAEYDIVINAASYQNGFNLEAFKVQLESSQEKSDRTAQVNAIKSRVQTQIQNYLVLSDADKRAYAESLGIEEADLISFSAAEANAILNWLHNQSLHFGQSAYLALEALLTQAGLSFDRIDLASRLILIDILTGTLTPFESSDLVLSVYALKQTAKHYGLITYAIKMDYAALKAMYHEACPEEVQPCNFRMAAHINKNHFVIITKVTNDEVTYIDPGKGPESNPEIQTLSADEFTQVWINSGLAQSGYGVVLSSRAPPSSVSSVHAQAMNTAEQMKVRGAFFGFLAKVFKFLTGAFFVAIDPIWALIVAVSKELRTAILAHLDSFTNLFEDIFTFNFRDVFHKDIWKIFRTGLRVGTEILNGPIEKTQLVLRKLGFSEKATLTIIAGAKIVVGVILTIYGGSGVGLLVSGISDLLNLHTNLPPTVKSIITISAAVVATIAGGGFDGGFQKAIPYMAKEFAAVGVIAIGDAIGLDPRISALISVPISAAVGAGAGRIVNGRGMVAGISESGSRIYVPDTRSFLDYVQDTALSSSSLASMVSIGASIALDAVGAPVLASGFLSGLLSSAFVGGGADGSAQGQSILSRIGEGLRKFGQGVSNAAGSVISFGQKIIQGAGNVTSQGFKKAVSAFSSIFSRQTQEEIYADESGLRQANVTQDGDVWTWQSGASRISYNTQTGEALESFGVGGTARVTGLGQDEGGNFYYQKLTYETAVGDGAMVNQIYNNGKFTEWSYNIEGRSIISVKGPNDSSNQPWITSEGWIDRGNIEIEAPILIDVPDDLDTPGLEAKQIIVPLKFNFTILGGVIVEALTSLINPKPSNGNSSAPETPVQDRDLYVLVNGINNDKHYNSPSYLLNLQKDIVAQSESEVAAEDIILAPTFFKSLALALGEAGFTVLDLLNPTKLTPLGFIAMTSFGSLINQMLNGSKDVISLIQEMLDPVAHASLAGDIVGSLEGYFTMPGNENDRGREMIGVGYSGGFMPLAEVFLNNRYNPNAQTGYNAKSLVGLGGANFKLDELSQTLVDKAGFLIDVIGKIQTISTTTFAHIENELEKLINIAKELALPGISDYIVETTMNYLRQGLFTTGYDYIFDKTKEMVAMLTSAQPISLIQSNMNVVVNVYGTKDVLNEFHLFGLDLQPGLVGYRDEIGGYSVNDQNRPLVNVEIIGATHSEYLHTDKSFNVLNGGGLVGGASDWVTALLTEEDRLWNKKVSTFVADLITNSKSFEEINRFLNQPPPEHGVEITPEGGKWIIKLPGWEGRA